MEFRAITTVTDKITSQATGTDTNTISIAAGTKVRLYGIMVGQGKASADLTIQVRVDVGTTEVLVMNLSQDTTNQTASTAAIMFPSGTYYEGADGEDIVVDVQVLTAAATINDVSTTVFYEAIPSWTHP